MSIIIMTNSSVHFFVLYIILLSNLDLYLKSIIQNHLDLMSRYQIECTYMYFRDETLFTKNFFLMIRAVLLQIGRGINMHYQ